MAESTKTKSQKSAPNRTVPVLDGKQRRYLRSLAHSLQPVLQIGKGGASDTLLKELDRALEAHELVKVRVLRECPTELDEILELAARTLGVASVGTTGKVAVLYRRRAKDPRITLPDVNAPNKPKKPKKAAAETSQAEDDEPRMVRRSAPKHAVRVGSGGGWGSTGAPSRSSGYGSSKPFARSKKTSRKPGADKRFGASADKRFGASADKRFGASADKRFGAGAGAGKPFRTTAARSSKSSSRRGRSE